MKIVDALTSVATVALLLSTASVALAQAPDDPRWTKLRLQDTARALDLRDVDMLTADDQLVDLTRQLAEAKERITWFWAKQWHGGETND